MAFESMLIHPEPEGPRSYFQQWTAPPTVIAVVVAAGTMWGGWVVQQERMDSLRARVESVERDYQRREVLTEQLRNIDARLNAIERQLNDRSPLLR